MKSSAFWGVGLWGVRHESWTFVDLKHVRFGA